MADLSVWPSRRKQILAKILNETSALLQQQLTLSRGLVWTARETMRFVACEACETSFCDVTPKVDAKLTVNEVLVVDGER